ncbi:MAG TPA: sucrase ferredoxin [Solirubrobacteraceae bacterium]|nr:sucrase ferredoxin [Solirubrobacteraceae bacterium]
MTTPCSVLGERLGEDLAGSAPAARRFLLLEQPGPWTGRNAVTHSDLDEGIARALLARADALGLKVHLIRRSSRRAALERRTVFVADTGRDGPWLARHEIRDPAEVLDLDLEGGQRWAEPVYAVCTHGKRDPCCARRGRPLARALRAARPDETWEIGHIGGHRFAATFIAFPHGVTFGRVPAAAGPAIVAGYEAGLVALDHLRGRAGDPWPVQAADVLVRRRLGLRGIDDVVVEGVQSDPGGGAAVVVLRTGDGGALRATVTRRIDERARPLSCGDELETVPVYALADFVAADRAA